jgi:hypothetical protein
MTDFEMLAELSHGLERSALALAESGSAIGYIATEIQTLAAGQREVIAIALSYLLRERSLRDGADDGPLANAIDALVLALRRTR